MDIRDLDPDYSVASQITPDTCKILAEQGFQTIICNRPDLENPPALAMAVIRDAAEAAGLAFVENPVAGGVTLDALDRQRLALAEASGPVLAYCASGTRSAVLWAFVQAETRPVEEILAATAKAGYALDGLAPQLASRSTKQV